MKYHYPTTLFLCFDGEGDGLSGSGEAAAAAAAGKGGDDSGKVFSQADLNRILAEDKRKHQEKMAALEAQLESLSQDKSLTEQARAAMATQLEDVRKTYRTKEQELEFQRKQEAEKYGNELKMWKEKAETVEKKYRDEKVFRSLQDATVTADVFNPNQIVALLRPLTELKDSNGELVAMIDFPDIDEKTGEEIRTLRTPVDAVKRMKELPKLYGNLFRSNIVSGVGSGQGIQASGEINKAELTTDQYMKLRAENPEKLGLPARNRRK